MHTIESVKRKQVEAVKAVIMKYFLPDCLKPEYNGMTAYEIAGLMITASDMAVNEAIGEDHDEEEADALKEHCICRKCGDFVLCTGTHDPDKSPHELVMCMNCAS